MNPIYFNLSDGSAPIIVLEKKENPGLRGYTFHLYFSCPGNEEKSLNNLYNHAGLVSFDEASQEFHFTAGNLAISSDEMLQVINVIKINIC